MGKNKEEKELEIKEVISKPEEVKELGEEVPRLQQEYKNPFISKKK